jgi:hypothetical protein
MKAKHTPGKTEWAMASAASVDFRRKAKQPTNAAEIANNDVPHNTHTTLASLNSSRSIIACCNFSSMVPYGFSLSGKRSF